MNIIFIWIINAVLYSTPHFFFFTHLSRRDTVLCVFVSHDCILYNDSVTGNDNGWTRNSHTNLSVVTVEWRLHFSTRWEMFEKEKLNECWTEISTSVNFNWGEPGGGGLRLKTRAEDANFLAGGESLGASSPGKFWNLEARKWYFQHSQWDISLKPSTWIRCKMTGTSSALTAFTLILKNQLCRTG